MIYKHFLDTIVMQNNATGDISVKGQPSYIDINKYNRGWIIDTESMDFKDIKI